MKIRLYDLMERCVKEGVEDGFRAAHHRPAPPTQAELKADVAAAVLRQFQRWFVFEQPAGDFTDSNG